MNVKRFTARTSRDALGLVKQAFGQDAVVLSTRPSAEGVEVLAMSSESVQSAAQAHAAPPPAGAGTLRDQLTQRATPSTLQTTATQDADRLAMSTLSFQDYVRERMLRRRRAELSGDGATDRPDVQPTDRGATIARQSVSGAAQSAQTMDSARAAVSATPAAADTSGSWARGVATDWHALSPSEQAAARMWRDRQRNDGPSLGDVAEAVAKEQDAGIHRQATVRDAEPAPGYGEWVAGLQEVKELVEQRFGALAYMEKLQRDPRQVMLAQRLLEAGLSPVLTRRLAESLPPDVDPMTWASSVLERNLQCGDREPALEEAGGALALIGPTGVGKTTAVAKLAASFAAKHGATELGLITLDAHRTAGHEQLRAYGRMLGVPVHTAHDRASLEDLLDLLSAKKLVLIDTAGLSQRDERTPELLEMLSHRLIQRVLVMSAACQGETLDDVFAAFGAAHARGVVLSKLDEAAKLGPALDALIRHKLKVLAVANGQRVPEDWHRLAAATLIQRALRQAILPAWKREPEEVSLVLTATPAGLPDARALRQSGAL